MTEKESDDAYREIAEFMLRRGVWKGILKLKSSVVFNLPETEPKEFTVEEIRREAAKKGLFEVTFTRNILRPSLSRTMWLPCVPRIGDTVKFTEGESTVSRIVWDLEHYGGKRVIVYLSGAVHC